MANTFELIASSTVGAGGAASIDFTSIPSTYTDLVVKVSARSTGSTNDYFAISFNGSTANFTERYIIGNGSTATSGNDTGGAYGRMNRSTTTASTFGTTDYYVPQYAGSTNKSISVDTVSENNATLAYADFIAGLWSNTAAINRVTLTPAAGNFAEFSTAYIYGVKNA